jgi:type III pantothenate kinase
MARILCLDVGNTTAHWGLAQGPGLGETGSLPTDSLEAGLAGLLDRLSPESASLASVVPAATASAWRLLARLPGAHHLRHDTVQGLGFDYPNPAEVGQDRLANCIGAQVTCGAPAVIVDMGTATTFDVLTDKGYAGGVIAPGLSVMTSYLHGRTALLPELDPASIRAGSAIGKSTLDAMRAGCALGFAGMIERILEALLAELAGQGVRVPTLLVTGGTADFLPPALAARLRREPNLTLLGLAESWRRAQAG